jgi:hypothetical protein
MLLSRPKVVGVSRSKAEDDLARMLVIRTSLEAEMGASRAFELKQIKASQVRRASPPRCCFPFLGAALAQLHLLAPRAQSVWDRRNS